MRLTWEPIAIIMLGVVNLKYIPATGVLFILVAAYIIFDED